ncbi:hypothetical protein [Pseudomonas gessardii]|uniref:hypothetical protein n=1 Tax=Pseudomonas gessardii TaxID=78544 RepID=UPI0018D7A83B|nr:hypothetical protein [Pseudomonas gessardii]MBH3423291.1 hypothetical protein [Pseudomonas gessardii]
MKTIPILYIKTVFEISQCVQGQQTIGVRPWIYIHLSSLTVEAIGSPTYGNHVSPHPRRETIMTPHEITKSIMVTINKDAAVIEFITTTMNPETFLPQIQSSYAVRVSKNPATGEFTKVSAHGDIDQDNDVDAQDKALLIELATAASKIKLDMSN